MNLWRDWGVNHWYAGMLLHHMDFCGIWLKHNTLRQFQLVWFERRHQQLCLLGHLFGSRWFPEFPTNGQKNSASHAQILANPASRGAVKSQISDRYLSFSRFLHCILVKSWIPRIPFQTLYKISRKWKAKIRAIMWHILQLLLPKLCVPFSKQLAILINYRLF